MRKPPAKARARASKSDVRAVVESLKRLASARAREDMTKRYGIPNHNAFGVPMAKMQQVAKRLGKSHELAAALWATGNYEARTVAAFVDEPARITPAQMDRWARDFDSWAICDTVCFKLFDQVPHAYGRIEPWSKRKGEFEKRAAFALLACLALHDGDAGDAAFAKFLPLVERAARDERNFVKKGVVWALRGIATRGEPLRSSVVAVATRLSASSEGASAWVGRTVLRELGAPTAKRNTAAKRKAAPKASRAGIAKPATRSK